MAPFFRLNLENLAKKFKISAIQCKNDAINFFEIVKFNHEQFSDVKEQPIDHLHGGKCHRVQSKSKYETTILCKNSNKSALKSIAVFNNNKVQLLEAFKKSKKKKKTKRKKVVAHLKPKK